MSNKRTTQEHLIGKDVEGNGLAYYDVIYREWRGRSEEGDTKLRGIISGLDMNPGHPTSSNATLSFIDFILLLVRRIWY